MKKDILNRILKSAGNGRLVEILSRRLSPPDLQSLLLEVYKRRAGGLTPSRVLRQYEESRFVRPAMVSPRRMMDLDMIAFSLLPEEYEVLELSPVAPLGSCSILGPVDQYNVVATIRNNEVCSDATNVLALESALVRREYLKSEKSKMMQVKRCASHRLLRPQLFSGAASFSHFRLFGMVTAGRDTGSFGFEITALCEHIGFFIDLITALKKRDFSPGDTRVALTAFDRIRIPALESGVAAPLSGRIPDVRISLDRERTEGAGYYSGAGYRIYIRNGKGEEFLVVDGGFTDWTQRLLGSRKERFLTSGMGTERFIFCFDDGNKT
ncbi:MAG: hypothetical protein JW881_04355 [Spirochaetales bacterium]|nr:hypothetical protein [Spirochaetales bacterium]